MTGDGKIDSGEGWVRRVEDADVMVAVLERWFYVHGPEPGNVDIEYRINGEAVR